jgi:hypothetical protein
MFSQTTNDRLHRDIKPFRNNIKDTLIKWSFVFRYNANKYLNAKFELPLPLPFSLSINDIILHCKLLFQVALCDGVKIVTHQMIFDCL